MPCHRRLSYAGCDGYEVAFANPENNKTGLLDNNLSKKITLKTINMDKGAKKNTEKSMKSRSPMGCLLIYVG